MERKVLAFYFWGHAFLFNGARYVPTDKGIFEGCFLDENKGNAYFRANFIKKEKG